MALADELGAERRQRHLAPVEEQHPGLVRVDAPELVPQGERRELADLPGQLDPGRPRPDESERQPAAALRRVRRGLRHLERPEDPPADRQGVRQRLHPGSEPGELVVTEVGLLHAGRDDEVVVRDLDRGACRPQPDHPPALDVDVRDLGEDAVDVLVAAEHAAQGHRDLSLGEDASGALVEQRLEQVMGGAVDHRHLHRAVPERAGSEKAGEAAADDHHSSRRDVVVEPVRLAHRSRSSRWSPTRNALAIAVREGFTAPMLGKKLVSTT